MPQFSRLPGLMLALLLSGCATTRHDVPLTGEAAAYQRDVTVLASDNFEGREAGTAGNERATAWVVEQFRAIGLRPALGDSYLQAFALPNGKMASNVVGYLPGAGEGPDSLKASHADGEVVIIGAHFDHLGYGGPASFSKAHAIHPGADDNASGVAGLLLLARRYAQRPDNRRTLFFVAFNGEESQMLGSKYMAAHLDELHLQKQNIAAMINMDMIGRLRDDMLYVFGLDTSDQWPARIARAMSETKSTLHLRPFGTANTASDQQPFAEAGAEVLFFFTGKHEDYHRVTDTAEKINSGGAVQVMEVVDRLIADF